MKRCLGVLTFLLCLGASSSLLAQTATVAAAAAMKYAMDEIVMAYGKAKPQDRIQVVYGSTGRLHAQIQQGAPYDLFFSADVASPTLLAQKGFAASEVKIYAVGRLVIWSKTVDVTKLTLADLANPTFTRIAVANPKHAPYGQRAEEALRSVKVWETLKPKLVFGENITQTAQFVSSGSAQVGLIALSLAQSPALKKEGAFSLVPQTLHRPLEQAFIVTKQGTGNRVALQFAAFMESEGARAILVRYGYSLPATQGL